MAWCLAKYRDNFIFTIVIYKRPIHNINFMGGIKYIIITIGECKNSLSAE